MPNPKKPTHLRVLQGNPARRPLPKNEPKPRPKAPPCPRWLGATGRAKWKQLSPILKRLGLLTELDGDMLASYCHHFEEWIASRQVLAKEGDTFTTDKGYVGPHPKVASMRWHFLRMERLAQQFGMTPSSRTGIEVPPDGEPSDPFDEWMRRKK